MARRLWMIDEHVYREQGEKRWQVSWYTVKKSAQWKLEKDDEDIDFDSDLVDNYEVFPHDAKVQAMKFAQAKADSAYFGVCDLSEEVVEMLEDMPSYGEWNQLGDREEVHPA